MKYSLSLKISHPFLKATIFLEGFCSFFIKFITLHLNNRRNKNVFDFFTIFRINNLRRDFFPFPISIYQMLKIPRFFLI